MLKSGTEFSNDARACSCGCAPLPLATQAEPCGCGCICCDPAFSDPHDEATELQRAHEPFDQRLTQLDAAS